MMKNRSMLVAAAAVVVAGLPAMSAAGQEATDSTGETWDIVYIGASWLPEATRLLGEDIKADMGVDVAFAQRNEQIVRFATRKLQSGQWDIVKDAEVIVVSLTETTDGAGYCLDSRDEAPYPTTPERFRADIDAFLSELTQRADPKSTIIRVTEQAALPHFKALWAERGVEEACLAGWMDLNAQWKEGAAAVGIPSVDFVAAWNGPDGAGDAPREYFVGDGGHLSQQGARAAADVLREAGYGPLVQ
jgi:hypothetical protein